MLLAVRVVEDPLRIQMGLVVVVLAGIDMDEQLRLALCSTETKEESAATAKSAKRRQL